MYQSRLTPLFHPGRLLVTPAAFAAMRANRVPLVGILLRHVCGDWGSVPQAECRQNDLSVDAGLRLLSIYDLPGGEQVSVITEWDRSNTAIQLSGDRRLLHEH
jgi:hypothetical protein